MAFNNFADIFAPLSFPILLKFIASLKTCFKKSILPPCLIFDYMLDFWDLGKIWGNISESSVWNLRGIRGNLVRKI
ncbi:hypothetical protein CCY99_00555 [Helicobacter sp. 16-1353]|nr:hypothetical protein CCY99_00555 [Helicobacter sp. 16-1353]